MVGLIIDKVSDIFIQSIDRTAVTEYFFFIKRRFPEVILFLFHEK